MATAEGKIESLAAEIAGRAQPLTRNQIKQHARRHGVDPTALLTAVRRLRSQPCTGEELEEQRRRSAAGVAKSRRRQRLAEIAAERFEREVEKIHAELVRRGWALEKISDSGSRYLVYRLGANSANQPYTDRLPIAVVEAKNRKTACGAVASRLHNDRLSAWDCHYLAGNILASVGDLSVYANQSLTAVPHSRAKRADWNEVLEEDAIRRLAT